MESKVHESRSRVSNNKDLNDSQIMADQKQKRKMKRSDSERKRVMEAKLLRYYQSLVREVDPYGHVHDSSEQMLDGTEVDA